MWILLKNPVYSTSPPSGGRPGAGALRFWPTPTFRPAFDSPFESAGPPGVIRQFPRLFPGAGSP